MPDYNKQTHGVTHEHDVGRSFLDICAEVCTCISALTPAASRKSYFIGNKQMNKFNRPRGNAVKQRKIKQRAAKKRSGTREKNKLHKVQVSAKRTGGEFHFAIVHGARICKLTISYYG